MKPFLSEDQMKLYTLIWQKFIATQMNPAVQSTKTIEIAAGDGIFIAKGSTIESKGFLEVFPHRMIILGENIDKGYENEDTLNINKLEKIQNFTKPPARFTEASLIKELESKGIGRPSTYASITGTIITRKYVLLMKKKFFPTELGRHYRAYNLYENGFLENF